MITVMFQLYHISYKLLEVFFFFFALYKFDWETRPLSDLPCIHARDALLLCL